MKKISKLLCALLAMVLVLTSAGVAFAKEEITPIILVHGVGGSQLYENLGTDEEKKIVNNGLGEIKDIVLGKNMLADAITMLSSQGKFDGDKLVNTLSAYVKGNPFNCDKDGNPKAGQGIKIYWEDSMIHHRDYWENATISEEAVVRQLCKTVGSRHVYAFNYDWRNDACYTAKNLRKMIVKVKKNTGAKKVALVGCSFGGAVLSAYMDAYKQKKDVERYVFVNPAMNGVDVARMYAQDVDIDVDTVLAYLDGMQDANPGSTQQKIMKVVKALGDVRVRWAAKNLKSYVSKPKNVKKISMKILKPWLGNVPALYECMPYGCFNKAMKTLTSWGFLEKDGKLYKKLRHYHAVQGRFNKNIKWVKKHGAEVAIIANYGMPAIPVTSRAHNHIDGLIDTHLASAGATVADYGKTLKGKKAKGKYVSPDKIINAKTCVLPDNTWFLKDVQHMQFRADSGATKFVAKLCCGKVKLNLKAVKKKYKYSQFLKADDNQNLSNVRK